MYESYIPTHLTDPLWQRLAYSKIFITGGTGLFGHWILDSLTDANKRLDLKIEATVLTRNPEKAFSQITNLDPRIRFIKGHVENFVFPFEKFDIILHMATTSAEETFNGADQSQKLKMLYEGTQRVLEFAQISGAKRILFTSSGAVYGGQNCNLIKESAMTQIDTLNEASGLALGKSVAEYLLQQAYSKTGLEVIIARCFSFVGPGIPLNLHYAIGNFIKSANEGSFIDIKSDGLAIRSYMFMGDLVWWLIKLLIDGKSGEVYNVGSDEAVSVVELAKKVKKIFHLDAKIIISGNTNYSVGVPVRNVYLPSIEKARNELNLNINSDLNTSLEKMCKSIRIQ
jgi:UDP-glucuronate decarboxylase